MTVLEREEFILLSEIAVMEEDQDKLVSILIKRNANLPRLFREDLESFLDELKECLSRENLIIEKLEMERHKIVERMEKISKARKTSQSYSVHYPLPFSPKFFTESK
jgi:hypothetical protein